MSVKSNCFGPFPYQQMQEWDFGACGTLITLVETPEQTQHRHELHAAMVTQERREVVCREHRPPNVLQPWNCEGWKVSSRSKRFVHGLTAYHCSLLLWEGKPNHFSTQDSACDKHQQGRQPCNIHTASFPSPGKRGEKLCFQEGIEKQQNMHWRRRNKPLHGNVIYSAYWEKRQYLSDQALRDYRKGVIYYRKEIVI